MTDNELCAFALVAALCAWVAWLILRLPAPAPKPRRLFDNIAYKSIWDYPGGDLSALRSGLPRGMSWHPFDPPGNASALRGKTRPKATAKRKSTRKVRA